MTEAFERPTCQQCGHQTHTYAAMREHVRNEHGPSAANPIITAHHRRRTARELARDGLISTRTMCELAGITYRQADYWLRAGYITATVDASGSGTRRSFNESDVLYAAVLGTVPPIWARDRLGSYSTISNALRDAGPDAPSIRLAFDGEHPAVWLYIDLDIIRGQIAERRTQLKAKVS